MPWHGAGRPHWNEVDFHHPTLLACILLISMDQLSNNMIYFLQCPTLFRSLWKRAEQQISHLRRRRCLVVWRSQDQRGMRLKLWFHINMSDRSGHVKDIQRSSVYFWCISCQCEHLLAMQRMQRMYKRMYDMNWYDRYLHRKWCAHVRKKVSKQVKHALFPIMQSCPTWADQNPWDFKMNCCRLIWPLLRGTSRCACRRCRCPVLTAPKYVTSRSNATCLHMDMGMPWVHGAVRVGHIETRLTSITLLFLLVFCWFPWTNCRTWSIFSSAPHYSGHYGRERSNRSRTSDGDGVLSSEDLKINGEWDWSCGSTSICRIGRDMSKTFKDAVSTFDVFHANGSFY